MNFRQLRVIWHKEVIDNLRDWRSLAASFGLSVFTPLFFAIMLNFMINVKADVAEDTLELPVVGLAKSENLARHFKISNIDVTEFNKDPVEAITSGDEAMILIISDDFQEDFKLGRPAQLELLYDSQSLGAEQGKIYRIESVLRSYSYSISALRIQARGIDPTILRPIAVNRADLAPPGARAKLLLSSLPFFIVLSIFMGVYYLAIDTTAGERENGSLEPLLTLPISRADLVLGKIAATTTYGLASLLLTLLLFSASLDFVPVERLGIDITFGISEALTLCVLLLPLVLIASSALTVVASFTHSFKEAQTYLSLVTLVPTMPLIAGTFMPIKPGLATMAIPSLSQSLLIETLITSQLPSWPLIAVSVLSSAILALALCYVAVRLYQRENILGGH